MGVLPTYIYVYDLNGNLISKLPKLDAPAGTPEWAYGYDALDQLIDVTKDGFSVERYACDAFGRRSLIETANDNGSFDRLAIVNDGSDRMIDLTGENGGVIARRYTHGGNVDEPLQVETFDAAGLFDTRYTYHTDHF